MVIDIIKGSNSNIIGVSESNAQVNKADIMSKRHKIFEGYSIEDKIWQGYGLARYSIYVRKDLIYKRRKDLENEVNACIVIEIKCSKGKKLFIVGAYRQWRGKAPTCNYNNYENDHQVLRFKDLLSIFTNVSKLGKTVVMGDLNLDRHEPNDPMGRDELKDLIPLLEDFMEDQNMTLLNKVPTRHHAHHRSSLLDLYITNCPQKIYNIQNI